MPERRGAQGQGGWYGVIREIGLALVVAGVVVLLFVAYDLVGTNFAEQRSQARLAHEFTAALSRSAAATSAPARSRLAPPDSTGPAITGAAITGPASIGPASTKRTSSEPASTKPSASHPADTKSSASQPARTKSSANLRASTKPPSNKLASSARPGRAGPVHRSRPVQDVSISVPPGSALDHLVIPAIDVNRYVVEGVQEQDLQLGPGHYPGTPLPGQRGNVGIAGHRTTFGAPFFRLNELRRGDLIYLTDLSGTTWVYSVFQKWVVLPSDVAVLHPTRGDDLTLTTCNPRFWATTRLVVRAVLVERLPRGARFAGGLPARLEAPRSARNGPTLGGGAGATPATVRQPSGGASRAHGTTTLPIRGGAGTSPRQARAPTSPNGPGPVTSEGQVEAGPGSPVVGRAALSLGGPTAWTWASALGFGAVAVAAWAVTRLLAARRHRYAKVAWLVAGALVSLVPLWFAFGAAVDLLPANF